MQFIAHKPLAANYLIYRVIQNRIRTLITFISENNYIQSYVYLKTMQGIIFNR